MGVAMVTGAWPPAEWGRLAVNWPWIAIKVKTAGYLLESLLSHNRVFEWFGERALEVVSKQNG